MRTHLLHAVLALALAASAAAAAPRPARDLLGIELGMRDDVVRRRLEKLGRPERGADTPKQAWDIHRGPWRHVVVRYDREWRVKWVTAFARAEGRRLRYSDLGDLATAARRGRFIYLWDVRPEGGERYAVAARGTDSLHVSSVSLFRPATHEAPHAHEMPEDEAHAATP